MEREARRAERQRLIYEKAVSKQAMLEAAAEAAGDYERLINLLTSAHRVRFFRQDHTTAAAVIPPIDPPFDNPEERSARLTFEAYEPSWFARTFGQSKRQRKRLEENIEAAKEKDQEEHKKRLAGAAQRRAEVELAKALVAMQPYAVVETVETHSKISDVPIEAVSLVVENGRVLAVIDAFELEDMPAQSVGLLQSGKASVKALAANKRHDLHRDNICSVSIRVAVELLKVLPVEEVEVIAQTDLLDRGSGHIVEESILYARITAQALASVKLEMAEPTALAERLGAAFEWNRKTGFQAIDPSEHGVSPERLGGEATAEKPAT